MHALFRTLSIRDLLLRQAPAIGASMVIAETFYKFHSFTLECLAFLATWYFVDLSASTLSTIRRPGSRRTQ